MAIFCATAAAVGEGLAGVGEVAGEVLVTGVEGAVDVGADVVTPVMEDTANTAAG